MNTIKIQRAVVNLKGPGRAPRGGEAEPKCYVTASTSKPKGVCHFIGGAVVGAAPHLSYSLLIDLLAQDGYTVIQTPYPFTFRHKDLAYSLRENFISCLQQLQLDGRGDWVPVDAPVHGIGHSNGALMHLLIGSLHSTPVSSNVLLSYNNKQISDAIPIPGFVESSRPWLQEGRRRGMAQSPEEIRAALLGVAARAPVGLPDFARNALGDLGPVLSQVSSVLNEIEEGVADFDPSPEQSRAIIKSRYTVPDTLLIRYSDDGIDETPEMTSILRTNTLTTRVTERVIQGNHVSPCGGDLLWDSGPSPTVVDQIVMAGKNIQQRALVETADLITDYLQPIA